MQLALKPSRQQKVVSILGKAIVALLLCASCLVGYQTLLGGGWQSSLGQQQNNVQAKAQRSEAQLMRRSALPPDTQRMALKIMDPDVAQHVDSGTAVAEPGLKNPCWKSGSGQMKCLPFAYILGGFQSGAGTLYQKLAAHPDIILTGSSRNQFWGEEGKFAEKFVADNSQAAPQLQADPGKRVILEGSASTFGFYWSAAIRAHRAFQRVIVPCTQNCTRSTQGPERLACLDGHCYPSAMAADLQVAHSLNVNYDDLHLPAIISAAYGAGTLKPKMIALLRDPVERLHSAFYGYAHYQKYGHTPEGFVKYVREQVGEMKRCAKRHIGKKADPTDSSPMDAAEAERHCLLYFEALGNHEEAVYFHADQIIRGTYAVFLEVWMRYFPLGDQLLVIKSEDYFADPQRTLSEVYRFLGLDEPADPALVQKIKNAGQPQPKQPRPVMLPEARKILKAFYRPYNTDLYKLLGDKKWLTYNKA